jgi:hypothetical protein
VESRDHSKKRGDTKKPNEWEENNNKMKTYSVISESSMWSTAKLKQQVEKILNEKTQDGYEVVSVAFGLNIWWIPTAYITLRK